MNIKNLISELQKVEEEWGENLEVQTFTGELSIFSYYDEEIATIDLL